MNVWSITGNLGRDPSLRAINNGDPVLNLSVAVSRRAKVDGQWQNVTLWVDVTLFGRRAEALHKILAKGMRVGATGELNLREYQARDGTTKHQLELIARDVEPLDKASEARPQGGAREHRDDFAHGGYGSQRRPPDAKFAIDEDDDIPF